MVCYHHWEGDLALWLVKTWLNCPQHILYDTYAILESRYSLIIYFEDNKILKRLHSGG